MEEVPERVKRIRPDARPVRRGVSSRASVIFAVVGVVVALVAGGIYLFRQDASPRLTPGETVEKFLNAVFVASSAERLEDLVCSNWDPADALTRTTQQVDPGVRVSWDDIGQVSSEAGRVTLRARVGLRFRDDVRPSAYQQWRFSLVDEDGWRVCEARPFRF